MCRRAIWPALFVASLATSAGLSAQESTRVPAVAPQTFTLGQAMQYALDHYPTVRAALEQVEASSAGVSIAKSAYLPRLDTIWQSNRATANNVFGQLLPQSVIPAMSGPVLASASAGSVWGSATGTLFSWQPFDFGIRAATVQGAEAAVARSRAGEALTRLDVQTAVATACLTIVGAQRTVQAMQADVTRRELLGRVVHTLVDNQLRPGAEASRSDAEHAAARTRLIQAQQALTLAQITLGGVLGVTSGAVTIDATTLLDRLPSEAPVAPPTTMHPLAQVHQAAVDVARFQEEIVSRSDLPRLYVQSSVFARGSGANPNGQLEGGLDGLGLERANWAAGVQVVFPNVFDFATLRARKVVAAASTRAEAALYDEAVLTVTGPRLRNKPNPRPGRAIRPASPVLSKSRTLRTCSLKPTCRISSPASTSGGLCWRRRRRTARSRNSSRARLRPRGRADPCG
jgi:outer membrane protein TolC